MTERSLDELGPVDYLVIEFPPGQQRVGFSDGEHDLPSPLRSIACQQLVELGVEFLAAFSKPPPFKGQPRFPFSTFRDAFRERFSPGIRLLPAAGGTLKTH